MEKTVMQQLFSKLENEHPNLFNVYTTEGKEFINDYVKFIKLEKEQIDNKAIHFAEWLTEKHTLTLIDLYEQFEEKFYNNKNNNI
jgi:hypothetical protein